MTTSIERPGKMTGHRENGHSLPPPIGIRARCDRLFRDGRRCRPNTVRQWWSWPQVLTCPRADEFLVNALDARHPRVERQLATIRSRAARTRAWTSAPPCTHSAMAAPQSLRCRPGSTISASCPWRASSAVPPAAVATIGVSHAIASSTELGVPSVVGRLHEQIERAVQFHDVRPMTKERTAGTQGRCPPPAARASCRRLPSPAITSRNAGFCLASGANASTRMSNRFCPFDASDGPNHEVRVREAERTADGCPLLAQSDEPGMVDAIEHDVHALRTRTVLHQLLLDLAGDRDHARVARQQSLVERVVEAKLSAR